MERPQNVVTEAFIDPESVTGSTLTFSHTASRQAEAIRALAEHPKHKILTTKCKASRLAARLRRASSGAANAGAMTAVSAKMTAQAHWPPCRWPSKAEAP